MARVEVLGLLTLAAMGCALAVRGGGGGALTPRGPDGLVTGGIGFGGAVAADSVLLTSGAQGGARQLAVMTGVEYNRNLGGTERPFGLRARLEGGLSIETETRAGTTRAPSAGAIGVVPGLWWMPAQSVDEPHRFVLALELRAALRFPTDLDPEVRGFGALVLLAEWQWVPCTLFGGGSCREVARPVRPVGPRASGTRRAGPAGTVFRN